MEGNRRQRARTAASVTALWGMLALAGGTAGCADAERDTSDGLCAYPAGAHGFASGEVPPPTLSWSGWAEGGGKATIAMRDYLDCDGSKGIHALLVEQSTAWCSVCQRVARQLGENLHDGWRARGIHVLSLVTQTADEQPATTATALTWKQQFGLDGAAVVADPDCSMRGTVGEQMAPYPYQILIDPRTMEIVEVSAGYDGRGDFPKVVALAEKNAARK